jgi:hypothetical protein
MHISRPYNATLVLQWICGLRIRISHTCVSPFIGLMTIGVCRKKLSNFVHVEGRHTGAKLPETFTKLMVKWYIDKRM